MNAAQISQPLAAALDGFLRAFQEANAKTVTGTTAASTSVTALGDLTGVAIGDVVTGADITNTPPTTVVDLDNVAHTATLSQAATGISTGPLVFTPAGVLGSVEMGLYVNTPFAPVIGTLLSDFTEPTFAGYARVPMVIEAVQRNGIGSYLESYASCHFQPSADLMAGVDAQGYFIACTINGVSTWAFAEPFDGPLRFNLATDGHDILYDGQVQNAKTWGGYVAAT
jgi:hypothetical protein